MEEYRRSPPPYRDRKEYEMKQYWINWWLFLHVRWLWTRNADSPGIFIEGKSLILYKRGWSPVRFLPIYLFDYGLAVLLGRGVQSLSRAFRLLGYDHWYATGPLLWNSKDLWAR